MFGYLDELLSQNFINQEEYEALLPTGVRSPEELYAVTLHFPSLASALPGNNLAKISSISAQRTSLAFRNSAVSRLRAPVHFANGVEPPANTRFPLGSRPIPAPHKTLSAAQTPPAPIDHHSALRQHGWPVRDQGQRGTCVAHALAACKEALTFQLGTAANLDASEQFLFWGAKQFDPFPNTDGTKHEYALHSLQNHGLCDEAAWPYAPSPAATVHHGPPPAPAIAAAAANLHVGGTVTTNGNAARLHHALCKSPVAIGIPVFADAILPSNDNWNVGGLMEYGRVLDPQPTSVVTSGHAVCVVGFVPDASEPAGRGWFIIRNSWGTGIWGSQLPATGAYWGPEAGYGQISWSYVDSYLWEMCSL